MASGSQATQIIASTGGTPLNAGDEADPHIWHSVGNSIIIAQNIRDGLIATIPSQQATITANGAAYIAQLKVLDNDIQTQTATIPTDQRKLVTSHDTFGYFAARYGFEVVGTGLGSVTTESSDRRLGIVELRGWLSGPTNRAWCGSRCWEHGPPTVAGCSAMGHKSPAWSSISSHSSLSRCGHVVYVRMLATDVDRAADRSQPY